MKAALEVWGADSNLFNQGAAKQNEDPDVVAATMAKPGVMLKRPVRSNGPFQEGTELPRHCSHEGQGRACDLYWIGREEGEVESERVTASSRLLSRIAFHVARLSHVQGL